MGRGTEENTSRPGAAISILPKFENDEGARFGSSEATDRMVGEFAGAPVLDAALPAAALIKQPLFNAAWPAAVQAACTGLWPLSDIEMTAHLLATAQFMPASTLAVVPAAAVGQHLADVDLRLATRMPTPLRRLGGTLHFTRPQVAPSTSASTSSGSFNG